MREDSPASTEAATKRRSWKGEVWMPSIGAATKQSGGRVFRGNLENGGRATSVKDVNTFDMGDRFLWRRESLEKGIDGIIPNFLAHIWDQGRWKVSIA
jgi:hypothetical protein